LSESLGEHECQDRFRDGQLRFNYDHDYDRPTHHYDHDRPTDHYDHDRPTDHYDHDRPTNHYDHHHSVERDMAVHDQCCSGRLPLPARL